METANLKPFLRENLDILFVGLNPSDISAANGHYFSVKNSLWNQLYMSGLITETIDKSIADVIVLGSTIINRNGWNYGIYDLVHELSDRNSRNIKPNQINYNNLIENIKKYNPKVVCILHHKVIKCVNRYNKNIPDIYGNLNKLIENSQANFFYVPFPHGSGKTNDFIVSLYKEIIDYLENL